MARPRRSACSPPARAGGHGDAEGRVPHPADHDGRGGAPPLLTTPCRWEGETTPAVSEVSNVRDNWRAGGQRELQPVFVVSRAASLAPPTALWAEPLAL